VAKAEEIPGLTPDLAYGEAAARILRVRAQELIDHAEGVLDVGDIERVHDMRVATRRLRAALEVFEPCFPRAQYRSVLAEVKELADALGERRDRDVEIDSLHAFAEKLATPDRPGVESLVSKLRDEQAAANEALVPYVGEERLTALHARLGELAATASAGASDAGSSEQASEAAALAAGSESNGGGLTSGDVPEDAGAEGSR
jgi:CHAD domain-containing protein